MREIETLEFNMDNGLIDIVNELTLKVILLSIKNKRLMNKRNMLTWFNYQSGGCELIKFISSNSKKFQFSYISCYDYRYLNTAILDRASDEISCNVELSNNIKHFNDKKYDIINSDLTNHDTSDIKNVVLDLYNKLNNKGILILLAKDISEDDLYGSILFNRNIKNNISYIVLSK
jgi:hypothetical protein